MGNLIEFDFGVSMGLPWIIRKAVWFNINEVGDIKFNINLFTTFKFYRIEEFHYAVTLYGLFHLPMFTFT